MNFDDMNVMAGLTAFHAETLHIASLIRTIDKYFDTIYNGSTKSQEYINFKEAILQIEESFDSAEAQRLIDYRNNYKSKK